MEKLSVELINSILARECVLFAGSGITAESGGLTWNELISYLKNEFNYSSPLNDKFRIMEDLFSKNDPEQIYQKIQERLSDVKLVDPILKLATLPWYTIFTTNYDCALENALLTSQKLNVRTIVTGQEFALSGLSSEILCVKLMGTVNKKYGDNGSMVLTSGELSRAKEERSRLFDTLLTHAANLSFLFLGYSFRDGVILETIDKLKSFKGTKKKNYYALFREEPDVETTYTLESNGVEIIVGDLSEFVSELVSEYDKRNPRNYASMRMTIGSDIINIDTTKVSSFLSLHTPVQYISLKEDVSPESFFKGNTHSFKPFELGWHYPRKEIEDIVNAVTKEKTDNSARTVEINGYLGTGRTFAILAAVYELIVNHRSLAIKIPEFSSNSIPSIESLDSFVTEVETNLSKEGLDNIRHIIFWCESCPDPAVLTQFEYLSLQFDKYPLNLLYESTETIHDITESSIESHKVKVNLNPRISDIDERDVANYLFKIINEHQFPERSFEEISDVIYSEKQFLPILYKLLDPAKRSINQLIDDEYHNLKDDDILTCVAICSLTSSFKIDLPISLLLKVVKAKLNKNIDYADIFTLISEKGTTFIKEIGDEKSNVFFSIYHPLIAIRILERIGKPQIDNYLLTIAEVFNFNSPMEADIITRLLIFKGVNRQFIDPIVFTDDGLEKSLLKIIERKPSRLILHHLARYYDKENKKQDQIIPLLKKGLARQDENDCLEEKRENVLTTLANIEWKNHKQIILTSGNDSKLTEIINFLIDARGKDEKNAHAYDIHARILNELAESKNELPRLKLKTQAIEVVSEGLNFCKNHTMNYKILNDLRIQILSEIDINEAENEAKDLLENESDGTGYYVLACIEYFKKKNIAHSLIYLNACLEANQYPPEALTLKIEIVLQDKKITPNYKELSKLCYLHCGLQSRDTWKSAYHKGILFFIGGKEYESSKYFGKSRKMAPTFISRYVDVFWMDNNFRRKFTGIIENMEQSSGYIYGYNIEKCHENIFFIPYKQDYRTSLKEGMTVDFELGFSPMGPIAFDVRPQGYKIK